MRVPADSAPETGNRPGPRQRAPWWERAFGTLVLFFAVRWLAMEVAAAVNRAEFAARPELDNWADPYLGTAVPASTIAAIAVLLAWAWVWITRASNSQRDRTPTDGNTA